MERHFLMGADFRELRMGECMTLWSGDVDHVSIENACKIGFKRRWERVLQEGEIW